MFRIKAIAAVALAGLGGATVGTDAYMASHAPSAPPQQQVVEQPAPVRARPAPEPVVTPDPDPVLVLKPVTIYAVDRSRHAARRAAPAAPQEQELVACSQWRSLETGPADRGVRTLCAPSPAAP
jgi:hypothetical protein